MKKPRSRLSALLFALSCTLSALAGADSKSLSERAETAIGQGDYRTAVVILKNAVRDDPERGDLRWRLAEAYQALGDYEPAEKEYRLALELGWSRDDVLPALARTLMLMRARGALAKIDPRQPAIEGATRAEIWAAQAIDAALAREVGEAEHLLGRATDTVPDNAHVSVAKGVLLAQQGQLDQAATVLQEALGGAAPPAYAWTLLGDIQLQRGDLDAAEAAYSKVLDRGGRHPTERMRRAEIRLAQGRRADARADLDALTGTAAGAWQTRYVQGLMALMDEAPQDAISPLELSIAANPANAGALYAAGLASMQLDNPYQAREYLRQAIDRRPDHYAARKLAATLAANDDDPEQVLALLGPAFAAGMGDEQGARLLAGALRATGRDEQAVQVLERLAEATPAAPDVLTELGAVRLALGNEAAAREALEQARTLDPASAEAGQRLLIRRMLDAGRLDEALEAAEAFVAEAPDLPMAHSLLGLVRLGRGDTAQARAAFQAALARDAAEPTANAMLALMARRAGDVSTAEARFEAILAEQPDHLQALQSLASLAAQTGDQARAASLLARAVEAHPDALAPRLSLAQLQTLSGNPVAALELLDGAPSRFDENPRYLATYGLAQLAAERLQGARATAEYLIQVAPDMAAGYALLSRTLTRMGRPEDAMTQMRRAVDTAPSRRDLREAYATMMARSGKYSAAQDVLEPIVEQTSFESAYAYLTALLREPTEATPAAAGGDAEATAESSPERRAMIDATRRALDDQDVQKAIGINEAWLDTHPGDVQARMVLADLLLRSDRVPDALEQYRQVLVAKPDDPVALNNLAWNTRQSQPQQALEYARRAFEVAPTAIPVVHTLATLLIDNGQLDDAAQVLDKGLQAHPAEPVLLYRQAVLLSESGELGRAIAALQALLEKESDFSERDEAAALLSRLQAEQASD